MHAAFHWLVTRTWWTYDSQGNWYSQPYHWLNLIEGTVWLVFAGLVLVRFSRYRNSKLELLYSVAFITFGLSDYREAYALHAWLILLKGINLIALLYLRAVVIREFYPQSKTY